MRKKGFSSLVSEKFSHQSDQIILSMRIPLRVSIYIEFKKTSRDCERVKKNLVKMKTTPCAITVELCYSLFTATNFVSSCHIENQSNFFFKNQIFYEVHCVLVKPLWLRCAMRIFSCGRMHDAELRNPIPLFS